MYWPPTVPPPSAFWLFEPEELWRLQQLRRRFQWEPDVFTDWEIARLRFVRWLVQTRRSQGG